MAQARGLAWPERLLLGIVGLGVGLAMVGRCPGADIRCGPVISVLFGLAALTGLAKSGTA